MENNKLLEEQRLTQRTQFDLEMMNELGYCSGFENYSRFLSGRGPGEPPPTLFDYLLLMACWWSMNLTSPFHKLAACIAVTGRVKRHWWSTASACHQRWITVRLSLKSSKALAPQTIYVSATPGKLRAGKNPAAMWWIRWVRPTGLLDPIIEVRPVATQVDDLLSEIRQRAAINERDWSPH
ncbi:hypothetical protein ACLBOM_25040 [Escherichia coli]